jgi:hypothetical protein
MAFADTAARVVKDASLLFDVPLGEAVRAGDLLANVSGTYYLADANNTRYATAISLQDAEAGDRIQVTRKARVTGFTGGTAGNALYLSDTAGDYAATAGTVPQIVGELISATEAWVEPQRFSSDYAYAPLVFTAPVTGVALVSAPLPMAGDEERVIFLNESGGALTSAAKVTKLGEATAIASSSATLADDGVTNTTTISASGKGLAAGQVISFTPGGLTGQRQPQSATVLVRYLVGATQ